jgi:hypothetical protein
MPNIQSCGLSSFWCDWFTVAHAGTCSKREASETRALLALQVPERVHDALIMLRDTTRCYAVQENAKRSCSTLTGNFNMSTRKVEVDVVAVAVGPAASSSSEPEAATTKKRSAAEADADLKRKRVGKLSFKKSAASSEKAAPDAKSAALAAFEAKQREQKQKQSERHDKFAMFKFNDKAPET